ncbi:MAG: hypothetical protein WCH75_26750 [Candidatus Binatia bacterium]
MEAKLALVDRLLKLERRACRVYQNWAANKALSADLRSFCRDMAEEEKQHLVILERSAGLLNFVAAAPQTATPQMEKIEAIISTAERASEKTEITADEALGHALAMESSELNQLEDAWLGGFRPDFATLTQSVMPAHEEHIRHLSNAIGRFTANENLHREAAALLSEYERQKETHAV